MDPRNRDRHHQQQQPQPQSQQQPGQYHHNLQPNHNSSYNGNSYNYPDTGIQGQDDFNQFFNTDPNPAFQSAWDGNSILDPQIQGSTFNQPNNDHWGQQQQQQQQQQQNGYGGAFSRPTSNAFNYGAYGNAGYPNYSSNTFDSMAFSNGDLLNNNQFMDSGYVAQDRSAQGETVSPAALESYPNTYDSFRIKGEDQSPTPDQQTPIQSVEPPIAPQQKYEFYDEELAKRLAEAIPVGLAEGDMLVKNGEELEKATGSQKLAPFMWIGTERIESEDPRVIFPRIVPRKSITEIRRSVIAKQAQRPWKPQQTPLLKKLKIKLGTPKSAVRAQAAAAAAVNNTSTAAATTPVAASPGAVKAELEIVESSSDSSSESDSTDHSESEEEAEPEEPSPLPSSRPSEPSKALEYDVIKTVWARRSAMLPGTTIKKALSAYWDIVKKVREAHRTASLSLQQAEAMKDEAKATKSKARQAEQRRLFEKVVAATLKHGHSDILERFGEMPTLLAAFYSFIADRFKAADYNAQLIHDCLKLLCGCNTMTQDLFEKTKLDKVVPKLAKKGNEEIKKLSEELIRIVAKSTAQKGGPAKVKEESAASPSKPLVKSNGAESASGIKRPRSSDVSSLQPAKKPAPLGAKASLSSLVKGVNGTASKGGAAGSAKSIGIVKTENKAGGASASGAPQPKVKHVVAKPSSLLAGLQSASKKPGTSMAAQKASQASENKATKPPESKPVPPPAPAPRAGFSFSETLANLGKAKPVETTKQAADDRPPETDEEKKKRLRKEERRKLRVKFKPGDSLVQIKIFHHDPEEELGHDDAMIRDVADVKNEGRMLKMHKDLEVDDDDEEEVVDLDVPWHALSEIDMSHIDYDILVNHYVTRSGLLEVQSEEREKQEQREKEKFVVIYASLADVPPNPREPLDLNASEAVPEVMALGEPGADTRAREAEFNRRRRPQQQQQQQQQQAPAAPIANVNQLLSMLNAQPTQQQPQPQQAPVQSTQNSGLEAIFAQFAGSGQQAPQFQMPQQPQQPAAQVDQSIMNALSIFNMQQQQQQQPAQQQFQFNQQGTSQATPDLSALLASMSGQQSNAAAGAEHFRENPERKRQWENQEGNGDSKRQKGAPLKYQGVPILPCKFYKEGKCRKGENCTYLHNT